MLNIGSQDKNTVEALCSELGPRVAEVESSPVLRSLLTSLGQLKYRHPPLIDAIMSWWVHHPQHAELEPCNMAGTRQSWMSGPP